MFFGGWGRAATDWRLFEATHAGGTPAILISSFWGFVRLRVIFISQPRAAVVHRFKSAEGGCGTQV